MSETHVTEETHGAERSSVRQWVTLRNSSMDVRAGVGTSVTFAHDLRSCVGKPHCCALVHEGDADELVSRLRVDLLAEGFEVRLIEMPAGGCELARAGALDALFAKAGITADDLVVAAGGEKTLSVASFACASWCGGVSLAEVPLDLVSALTAGTTPLALDVPGAPSLVVQEGSARFSLVDVDLLGFDPVREQARLAFAHMVATAMDDSDKAFGRLWDSAPDLMAGDFSALVTQLLDTVKSRGKVVSSTSLATRQSAAYGQDFARALAGLVGPEVPASATLGDALRFSARLAVGMEQFSVDDMLCQDELLERLGVGTTAAVVDPEVLVRALKAERFRRSRRFMLPLPRAIGRVRLAIVADDLIAEHARAWCAARPVPPEGPAQNNLEREE